MNFRFYSHRQRTDNINVIKYSDFQCEVDINVRNGFDPLHPTLNNVVVDLTQYRPFTHMIYTFNGLVWVADINTMYQTANALYTISGEVNPAATCIYSNSLENSILYIEYGDYDRSIKALLPPTTIGKNSSTKIEKAITTAYPDTIWFAVHTTNVVSTLTRPGFESNPVPLEHKIKALGASGDIYVMNAWTFENLQLSYTFLDPEELKNFAESISYVSTVRGVGGSDIATYMEATPTIKLYSTYDRGGIYDTKVAITSHTFDFSALQGRALYVLNSSPPHPYDGESPSEFALTWHLYDFDFSDNPITVKDYYSNISIDYAGLFKLNFSVSDSGSPKLNDGGAFTKVGFGYRYDWVTDTFYAVPTVDDLPIYTKMIASTQNEKMNWMTFGNLTVSKVDNQVAVARAAVGAVTPMVGAGFDLMAGGAVSAGGLWSSMAGGIMNAAAVRANIEASYLNSAALNNVNTSVGGSPNSVLNNSIRCIMYQTNTDINSSAAVLTTGFPSNNVYRGISSLTESVYKCSRFIYKPVTDSHFTYPAEFVKKLEQQLTTPFFYIP